MTKRMSRVEEIDAKAMAEPIRRDEIRERPALRVRDDAPSAEVETTTPMGAILDRLGTEERGALVLREKDGKAAAVVLSAERYAELAGCEVESEGRRSGFIVDLDGKTRPEEERLTQLMIEMVNPTEEWMPGTIIWRWP